VPHKVYLDNCCFNRPYDDQRQVRIRIEAEAKLYIQTNIEQGNVNLVWSYILDYENAANPYEIRQIAIQKWKNKASDIVTENETVLKQAQKLNKLNLKAKDALHVACAVYAGCEYFLTTDDHILGKADSIDELEVKSPEEMLKILEQ